MKRTLLFSTLALTLSSTSLFAQEYPLGLPVIKHGMEIQGVYLQPITMDTEGMGNMHSLSAEDSDVHLEADMHSVE